MIEVTVRARPDRENLQLAYTDPITGNVRTKSAGTSNWRKAERAAQQWQSEIEAKSNPSNYSWGVFRDRFEDEYATDNPNTIKEYSATLNKFETLIGTVKRMDLIDASLCSQFQAKLKGEGLKPATVAKHLRQLGVILNWAAELGVIPEAPKIRKPKLPKTNDRGRPLTLLEFARLLQATKAEMGDHAEPWCDLLKGMWLTGMRISEAHSLHWQSGPIRIDLDAAHPRIIYRSEGQKNNSDELVPLTPDAIRFFSRFKNRIGFVFDIRTEYRKDRATKETATNAVSAIGKKSGISTSQDSDKSVSSHDLRRTFGTRWAMRVHPIVLKALMRHADLKTTLKYYVSLNCDDVARQLDVHAHVQRSGFESTIASPNTPKKPR